MLNLAKPNTTKIAKMIVFGSVLLGISGCNQSSTALQSSDSQKPAVVQQPLSSGAPEIARINARGGTKIVALVNKQPITTNQLKRRVAFVKLRRMKGNSTSIAKKELIEEAIKMQEARRINAVVSSSDVNAAYARFAKSNKMPVPVLTKVLNQRGVTQRGFKDFIKASMSWQRAVGARVRADVSGQSAGSSGGQTWLPNVGSETNREREYTIQQIVFIVPKNQRSTQLARRRVEAKRFRNRVRGCENARELASKLVDVSVLDRGRLLESRLPPRWAEQIKSTPAGKVTRVQDDAKGIEMIAVCKKREVIGQGNKVDADLFTGKGFQKAASATDKKYLEELTKRAEIQRR